MLLGTCRVARVSRRRPRPWPLRRRVGGVDVITLPWSHMCTPDEAGAARAGRLSRALGTESDPLHAATASAKRCAVAHAPCGLMHAATGCEPALTGRTVVGHAGPVCPGLQTLPLRAAFAPTGAFGSACFVVSARRSARVFPSPAAQLSPSRARLLDPSFRSCERPTDTGPANQLVLMSALYSACKPSIPSVGSPARVRNRRPTCGRARSRA